MIGISLRGMRELERNFNRLANMLNDDRRVLMIIENEAEFLKDKVKARVPVKTGRLRRNVIAKKFSRQNRHNPSAFVAIDRNKRTGARHAHLIEYGTDDRWTQAGRYTGRIAARPFWRPVMRVYAKTAALRMGTEIGKLIERSA